MSPPQALEGAQSPSRKRPRVTLKIATSLDGKIALANGLSEWITGEKSREMGRRLRGEHDAIAVGSNTAVIDNPQLTARLEGVSDPVRVIFDTSLRFSENSNLAQTAKKIPVWVFCKSVENEKAERLTELGVKLLPIAATQTGLDTAQALTLLKEKGIETVLLEGGGTLAASFMKLDAIDVIEWFRAPIVLGGDGRCGIGELGLKDMSEPPRFTLQDIRHVGDDIWERYARI